MAEPEFLTNYLLISMPNTMDPLFHQSVIYLCEHNHDGAMGIIINHPTDITLADVLEHMDIPFDSPRAEYNQPILAGGPVRQERGFVVHRPIGQWQASLPLQENIAVTTSRDILVAILHDQGPQDLFVALGYTGWENGQLEKEIEQNLWLTLPLQSDLLFDIPYADRWKTAGKRLGIDFDYQTNYLSDESGHA